MSEDDIKQELKSINFDIRALKRKKRKCKEKLTNIKIKEQNRERMFS